MPASRKAAKAGESTPAEDPSKPAKSTAAPAAKSAPAKKAPSAKAVPAAKAAKAAPAKEPAAEKAEPVEPTAPAETDEKAVEEEAPLNRAARRAKGKGGAQQSRPHGPVWTGGSKGPAHTQRMWSNRRSGG